MKDIRERIIEILEKGETSPYCGHGFMSAIERKNYPAIADEILALDWYPKEFLIWLVYGSHPFVRWYDEKGNYFTDELTDKRWSIDELYNYWKNEIQ